MLSVSLSIASLVSLTPFSTPELFSPPPPPRSLSYANKKCSGVENALILVDATACVAGVNGEGEGEQERGRKMGDWGLARAREKNGGLAARDKLPEPGAPIFLPRSRSPSPFTRGYGGYRR